MKIKWLAHACFLMTSSIGTTLLTDPFDDETGYPVPRMKADIVTVSHSHYDHNNYKVAGDNFKLFTEAGKHNYKDIEICGVPSFHDEVMGAKRGTNIIFKFLIDGLRVCHLGDLGHIPLPGQVAELGEIDILMVPVGGIYTIDAEMAVKTVDLLKPAVIVPMHYMTEDLSFELDRVDKFLNRIDKRVIKPGELEIEINTGNLASYEGVVLFKYK